MHVCPTVLRGIMVAFQDNSTSEAARVACMQALVFVRNAWENATIEGAKLWRASASPAYISTGCRQPAGGCGEVSKQDGRLVRAGFDGVV